MTFRRPLWLIKLTHYEYWTWYLFFLPLVPYWLYLALKNRSFTYFTAVNACIPDGGVFGESKNDILEQIQPQYLPISFYVSAGTPLSELTELIRNKGLSFPIIAKPDVGGRGYKVLKLNNESELKAYLSNINEPFLIQEYVDFEIELGVFYARIPDQPKGRVTSVVLKEFLSVTGDGHSTVEALLKDNIRAQFTMSELRPRIAHLLNEVFPENVTKIIQPIGNHCLGTKFVNANYLINTQLNEVFDKIAIPIKGFDYGRFDMRVKSIEDLYEGKNIRIIELNGVTSEPGHVYDPAYKLWKAYRDIMQHMKLVSDISAVNRKNGQKTTPALQLLKTSLGYWENK